MGVTRSSALRSVRNSRWCTPGVNSDGSRAWSTRNAHLVW